MSTANSSAPEPSSATASAPAPNKKSTLFSDLPTELRLQIWSLALPGPRLLTINSSFQRNPFSIRPQLQFSTVNALSGLGMLHTCLEAREVVLGSFKASPIGLKTIPECGSTMVYPVYLNTEDTLYFVSLSGLQSFVGLGYRNIVRESGLRRIAVGFKHLGPIMFYDAFKIWKCITAFRTLEECVLVVPGTWEPECDLVPVLVEYEERYHQLKLAEEWAVIPPRCAFRKVAELEFSARRERG